MTFPALLMTKIIRLYQAFSSRRLPSCRYFPTCSRYALEAIDQHGTKRGVTLCLRRICRCHPWGGWGYDPVPSPTQGVEA